MWRMTHNHPLLKRGARWLLESLSPRRTKMATYHDVECAVKTANNELLATAINHLTKAIEAAGGTPPTWYLLTLDGVHARTTTTLQQRADIAEGRVTIVEMDGATAKNLRKAVPTATIIESTMQEFVTSNAFRPGGYNIAYFDWCCTVGGNKDDGSPQVALENFLRRSDQPYIVLAQTFSMRRKGARKGNGPEEPEWIRGTDNAYEDDKVFVCSNLAERALRSGYLPLWNLHFESMYRRPSSPSWMLFMCVTLWKVPTSEVPRHHWDVYNKNQVQIKERYVLHICIPNSKISTKPRRSKFTHIDLDLFHAMKKEDVEGQGVDDRIGGNRIDDVS